MSGHSNGLCMCVCVRERESQESVHIACDSG
jgi:hypothetical protein